MGDRLFVAPYRTRLELCQLAARALPVLPVHVRLCPPTGCASAAGKNLLGLLNRGRPTLGMAYPPLWYALRCRLPEPRYSRSPRAGIAGILPVLPACTDGATGA